MAELQHENEVLRDYIQTQAAERQSVIERYERLLDQKERQQPSSASTDPAFAGPQTTETNLLDSLLSAVTRLRSAVTRLRSRLGVS